MKEVKIQYLTNDTDKQKKVTECYLVDAETFGKTEEVIFNNCSHFGDDFRIVSIKESTNGEIIGKDKEQFYSCVISITTIDEVTAREKEVKQKLLIGADDFDDAFNSLNEFLKGSIYNLSKSRIVKSNIVCVL